MPSYVPNFDNITSNYINSLDEESLVNESLIIREFEFDNDIILKTSKLKNYNYQNISNYFEF
jgi:hypothetical protein